MWLRQWISKSKQGLHILWLSCTVLLKHPSLLIFHAGALLAIVLAIMYLATLEMWLFAPAKTTLAAIVALIAVPLIILFFYTCAQFALTYAAQDVFENKHVSIIGALGKTALRTKKIIFWVFISLFVRIVLSRGQKNDSPFGKTIGTIARIADFAWSAASFFVYQTLALESLGIMQSLYQSAKLIKQKFGYVIGATLGFGFIESLVAAPLTLLTFFAQKKEPNHIVLVLFMLWIVFATCFYILIATTKTIFKVAMYRYLHNQSSGLFDTKTMNNVFKRNP